MFVFRKLIIYLFHYSCQNMFIEGVEIDEKIARNQALKEIFFMMVVCIESRIPLFIVGKPGSSKSLARTIVTDAMQRENAHSDIFKKFKLVQNMFKMTHSNLFV